MADWSLFRSRRWRDVTALLDSAVVASASGVMVRRVEDRIEWEVGSLRLAMGAGIILPWGSLPPGYRPTTSRYRMLPASTGGGCEVTINTGGGLVINGGAASTTYRGGFSVATTAPHPSTHP